MKIYIICMKNDVPYPIGRDDGCAAYLNAMEAKERKRLIEEHDSAYCDARGGLKVNTLEGPEELLRSAGFRW